MNILINLILSVVLATLATYIYYAVWNKNKSKNSGQKGSGGNGNDNSSFSATPPDDMNDYGDDEDSNYMFPVFIVSFLLFTFGIHFFVDGNSDNKSSTGVFSLPSRQRGTMLGGMGGGSTVNSGVGGGDIDLMEAMGEIRTGPAPM
jgi:hypothetical protein